MGELALKRLLLAVIAAYRRWLSPLKGVPTCRFLPTCSEYSAEAISRHGTMRGSALSMRRIARCQPFGSSGYDPVPGVGE